MIDDNFKVDFIGIGAQKSASTWVFQCLKEHPEICGSSQKEAHFFSKPRNYKKGIEFYKSFFQHCPEEKLKGEITPEYLEKKKVASRIHQHFPEVKLLVCLRNPVERAYSHYRWAQFGKNRLGHYSTFKQAIDNSPVLTEKGLYGKHLKRYFNIFPRENILVQFFEDLKDNPLSFIQSIYDFLEVKPVDFEPSSVNQKENPTGGVKYKQRLPIINSIFWSIWNKLNPPSGYGKGYNFLERTGLRQLGVKILKLNRAKEKEGVGTKSSSVDDIDPEVRKYLRDFYKEDIKKLEQLLDKDLSHWKNEE